MGRGSTDTSQGTVSLRFRYAHACPRCVSGREFVGFSLLKRAQEGREQVLPGVGWAMGPREQLGDQGGRHSGDPGFHHLWPQPGAGRAPPWASRAERRLACSCVPSGPGCGGAGSPLREHQLSGHSS